MVECSPDRTDILRMYNLSSMFGGPENPCGAMVNERTP
jgi:hypothetical protein